VLLGGVAVCVKATDLGGRRRTWVPWSATATCPICVLMSWTVRTGTFCVGEGDVCVALSHTTAASNSGRGVSESLETKFGSEPSAFLRSCNMFWQVAGSKKLTGDLSDP